jgi:hypothetical protein
MQHCLQSSPQLLLRSARQQWLRRPTDITSSDNSCLSSSSQVCRAQAVSQQLQPRQQRARLV